MPVAQPRRDLADLQGELLLHPRCDPEADRGARDGCQCLHPRDRQGVRRLDQGDQQIGALPGRRQGPQPQLRPGDQ
ncbi:hypothetical protein chiPu_0029170 [Chiloscyllium punctatum]|uniref:Uncharacterized protein n=1 Tax=Chiloscyllium punctatum TaxID=137246 RepID=A0A401TQL6_CHIPU|nr:hypothetical protein [Chiloscyllium punctatum]